MATRNRTTTFIKFRDAVKQTKFPQSTDGHIHVNIPPTTSTKYKKGYIQLQPSDSSYRHESAASSLPPLWVDLSESVKDEMQRVRTKMSELTKAQARALLPNFENTKSSHEHTIEILTQEITMALKKCEKNLQRLTADSDVRRSAFTATATENNTICKNVQRSMASDLQALSFEFRKMSKNYLKKLEQQKESTSISLSSNKNQSDEYFDSNFDDNQILKVKKIENLSVEREQEINEIMSSVNDLSQIMKDISILVIDQGTIVDRIDYNIQNVSTSVQKGVDHLVKAEATQKRSYLIFCILLLMVLVLCAIVVLILKTIIL